MSPAFASGLMSGLHIVLIDVGLAWMLVGLVDMTQARGR